MDPSQSCWCSSCQFQGCEDRWTRRTRCTNSTKDFLSTLCKSYIEIILKCFVTLLLCRSFSIHSGTTGRCYWSTCCFSPLPHLLLLLPQLLRNNLCLCMSSRIFIVLCFNPSINKIGSSRSAEGLFYSFRMKFRKMKNRSKKASGHPEDSMVTLLTKSHKH